MWIRRTVAAVTVIVAVSLPVPTRQLLIYIQNIEQNKSKEYQLLNLTKHLLLLKRYVKDQEESQVTETEEQMTLSARLESIEQKLMKLQSLKDETVDELNFLINERN